MHTDEQQSIKAADVAEGESVAILVDAATAPNAVAVEHLHGTVIECRPRAVCLALEAVRGSTRRLWLPRRALVKLRRDRFGVHGQLARWWTPDDYQARILDRCRHVGILTAAASPSPTAARATA